VIAGPSIEPFGKSPVRYRDLAGWQKQAGRKNLPWKKPPQLEPVLPSFETLLVTAFEQSDHDEKTLGPLDMRLYAPVPQRFDVMAWSEHGRLKDLSYQWAIDELEKRADTGDLPLVAAIPQTDTAS
jgi:hypothetical protein